MQKKLIFLITLLLHSLFFIVCVKDTNYMWMWPDSTEYNDLANHIADGDGIINNDGSAQFYRLPCYPIFLAACYKIFGDSVHAALWVQIILSSFIPVLIFMLALTLFPERRRLALAAALFSMVHTGFALYSCMLTTEVLFMLLWLLFLILFFSCHPRDLDIARSRPFDPWLVEVPALSLTKGPVIHSTLFLAGGVLGLASLVRPIGLYVLVVAVVIVIKRIKNGSRVPLYEAQGPQDDKSDRFWVPVWDDKKKYHWRSLVILGAECNEATRDPLQCIPLIFSWLLIVTPWLVRNYLLTGALFFHTLPGLHFVKYTATAIIAERDHIERDAAYPIALTGWHKPVAHNEYERCLVGEQYTWSLVKQHPWIFIKTAMKQMLRTCCGLYAAQPLFIGSSTMTWHTRATTVWDKLKRFLFPQVRDGWLVPFVYLDMVMYMTLVVGSLSFLGYAVCMRSLWHTVFSFVPFMLLFVILTLSYGCARLRMPIEPFMIIMTCWWIKEKA